MEHASLSFALKQNDTRILSQAILTIDGNIPKAITTSEADFKDWFELRGAKRKKNRDNEPTTN